MTEPFDTYGVFIGASATNTLAALRTALRYLERDDADLLEDDDPCRDLAIDEIGAIIEGATNPLAD
jgi:hypothetical protein